jgi:hypothetical protein
MDEPTCVSSDLAEGAGPSAFAAEAVVEQTSAPFVGRWNRLISTTNWEKGRIISEWRERLMEAGAPAAAYCDEAWSRRVGAVSPQHVGRLRRVYQRFGTVHDDYPGLYWSHFQAAVDWHDAEMWLEGAVASGWSVARMRAERWQALGSLPDEAPREEDVVAAELDEDYEPADDSAPQTIRESLREVRGLEGETGREGRAGASEESAVAAPWEEPGGTKAPVATAPAVGPFGDLPPLPPDLAEALDALKLAILRQKRSGWREVSLADVLAALDALGQLARSPGGG